MYSNSRNLIIIVLSVIVVSLGVSTYTRGVDDTKAQEITIPNGITDKVNTLFQGGSLKVFLVSGDYVKQNQWTAIDNQTSNGYDIKSIFPMNDRFVVVLEKLQTS